jgi:diguanylate cyclase (GGDEF)-like protein
VLLYNRGLRLRQRRLKREVARQTAEIRTANLRLTELSYKDPLTGVANRRRLMEAIDSAIDRSLKRSLPIGLIVLDVDHFKDYNDHFGHLAGDVALRAVAQALQSATREQDLVSRFGGEEFACLLIDADLDVVARCAERMRALVEALPPRMLGNATQTITISAGILSRVPAPGDSAGDLLREADAALYRAKNEGRNCVRSASAVSPKSQSDEA